VVETPNETYEVPADDLFVVDPESPQRAYNPADADSPVTVLAIGTAGRRRRSRSRDPIR